MDDPKTSSEGLALMHGYEACRLKAYPDPASPFARTGMGSPEPVTIGWGDTGKWKLGDEITRERADELFAARLAREFEPGVLRLVKRTPTQAQFDAMVSLAYNIGLPNFATSTVLRKFNDGDFEGAAAAFLMWDKAQKRVMKGLQRRRWAEHLVFLGRMNAQDAIRAAEKKYA